MKRLGRQTKWRAGYELNRILAIAADIFVLLIDP
jgi:hypothetical protein